MLSAWRSAGLSLLVLGASACGGRASKGEDAGTPDASASAVPAPNVSASVAASAEPSTPEPEPLRCPDERMLAIRDAFCIDKWEATLVDKETKRALSPYYPPERKLAAEIAGFWEEERLRVGNEKAREMPLPILPGWQRTHDPEPMAVSRPGVVPNGYVSGVVAERACANAGKRLCKREEWIVACRGEQDRPFPYGETYERGACNIYRTKHPGVELHDSPSTGHSDPRLNLVRDGKDPLLRKTGATKRCTSEWGDEALYDMNGNLDEWVESETGRYVGGFFSRTKKDGCDSSVGSHPKTYFDYSTGVRCCWSRDEEDAGPDAP